MGDTAIQLVGVAGEPFGRLRASALALVSEAEQVARSQNLSKRTALPRVLDSHLRAAGFATDEAALEAAVLVLDRVRRGEAVPSIHVTVRRGTDTPHAARGAVTRLPTSAAAKRGLLDPDRPPHPPTQGNGTTMPITPTSPAAPYGPAANGAAQAIGFFEIERTFPDPDTQAWYERLIGLDEHKARLLTELEMLLYPTRIEAWSRRHHGGRLLRLVELQRNRVPLVLLEGDVGTGKTALAETIGDALARHVGGDTRVHLLKINTQIRGTGQVGEMSDLIVQAFTQAEARARALRGEPVLLLLDEADALASRRDTQQMHHEDKAGLNTVLQRLESLRLARLPLAALFITNRPDALDPAVRRRAALDLHFERPGPEARAEILRTSVPELGLGAQQISSLVELTSEGEERNGGVPFTASDLTDRLLPAALRAAYSAGRPLRADDLLVQARALAATPPMGTS